MPDRHKLLVAVHLLLFRDHKILLARRYNTGWGDGLYSVPAGHVETGETVRQATVREAAEEVGIKVNPKQLQFVHVMHRLSDSERVDFFFTVDTWRGEPFINEPNKCDDLQWFPVTRLPNNVVPYLKKAIKNSREKIYFSEFGWL